jgi:hypothetical protein
VNKSQGKDIGTFEDTLIKEHKKLIEEQGLFEEDLDFD